MQKLSCMLVVVTMFLTSMCNCAFAVTATDFDANWVTTNKSYTQSAYSTLKGASQNKSQSVKAWRKDVLMSQFAILSNDNALTDMSIAVSDFTSESSTIPSSCAEVMLVKEVYGDRAATKKYADMLDPYKSAFNMAKTAVQMVWMNINVPETAQPGTYAGNVTVSCGEQSIVLNYSFKVINLVQPDTQESGFTVDLWEFPYSVAEYYGIPESEFFGERHLAILREELKKYKQIGGSSVLVSVTHEWHRNLTDFTAYNMIDVTKGIDGKLKFDFTKLDKWINLNLELGINKAIKAYGLATANFEYKYYDEASKKYVISPSYNMFSAEWENYFEQFMPAYAEYLDSKGLFDISYIVLDERPVTVIEQFHEFVNLFKNKDGKEFKLSAAIYYSGAVGSTYDNIEDIQIIVRDVASREAAAKNVGEYRGPKGLQTSFYICTTTFPNTFLFSDPSEAQYCFWYMKSLGFDGFLRLAYDAWVVNQTENAWWKNWEIGDCYLVYPGDKTDEVPVTRSSPRMEKLILGAYDAAKYNYLYENSAASRTALKELLNNVSVPNNANGTNRDKMSGIVDDRHKRLLDISDGCIMDTDFTIGAYKTEKTAQLDSLYNGLNKSDYTDGAWERCERNYKNSRTALIGALDKAAIDKVYSSAVAVISDTSEPTTVPDDGYSSYNLIVGSKMISSNVSPAIPYANLRDGTRYGNNAFSLYNSKGDAWCIIDLQKSYNMKQFVLYPRTTNNFITTTIAKNEIYGSNDNETYTYIGKTGLASSSVPSYINKSDDNRYRYIKIKRNRDINISELEIYCYNYINPTNIAQEELNKLMPIEKPIRNETQIKIPTLPNCNVKITGTSPEGIVSNEGVIINRPVNDTVVSLTLEAEYKGDSSIKATKTVTIMIEDEYKGSVEESGKTLQQAAIEKSEFTNKKYGIFIHYVAGLTKNGSNQTVGNVDTLANAFDAEQFAKDMSDFGVEYVIFTVTHYKTFTLYPSDVQKRWRNNTAEKTYSERDVINDLSDELSKYNIDLVLYTHTVDGHDFSAEDQIRTGWTDCANHGDGDHSKWNQYINELFDEMCNRYKDKIKGFWIDGMYVHTQSCRETIIDFERLHNTVTAYNPAFLMISNIGGYNENVWKDVPWAPLNDLYSVEAADDPSRGGVLLSSEKMLTCAVATDWWAADVSRVFRKSTKTVFNDIVMTASVSNSGGYAASLGNIAVKASSRNGNIWTGNCREKLLELNDLYIEPVAESIKNTKAGTMYVTPKNKVFGQDNIWGYQTMSVDGKYVYLHVTNPTDNHSVVLPRSADDTVLDMSDVTMLNPTVLGTQTQLTAEQKAVQMWKTADGGYKIALGKKASFDPVDTVIKVKVKDMSAFSGNEKIAEQFRNDFYSFIHPDFTKLIAEDYEDAKDAYKQYTDCDASVKALLTEESTAVQQTYETLVKDNYGEFKIVEWNAEKIFGRKAKKFSNFKLVLYDRTNVKMVVARYSSITNALQSVEVIDINDSYKTYHIDTIDVSKNNIEMSSRTYMKIFVVDSFDNMKPISEVQTLTEEIVFGE